MPRTFRDAILATRRLGIKYIWIDALCIVQDDPDEWREQSTHMGSIFERSTCTLAAVDALENEDCEDDGLFLARPANPLSVHMNIPFTKTLAKHIISRVAAFKGYQCVWKIKWLTPIAGSKSSTSSRSDRLDTAISHHRLVLRPRILSSYFRMNKSAWAHRGWVMQERFLSRRVIYFTRDKLYWDCLKVSEDEEHAESLGSPLRALGKEITGKDDRRRNAWEFIVSEYSSTVLTYNQDKLAALMGLTSSFKKRFSSRNYVGIDGDRTGFGLLWHAKDTYLDIYSDFHAPSWTWAAYNGPISYYCAKYAESHYSLASRAKYSMNFSCPYQNSHKHDEDSLCSWGLVSLKAPIGITYTCGKRIYGDTTLQKDSELLPILGKSIYREQKPIPRYTQNGQLETPPRTLSLPKHTEILFDENGRYNGWFIRDIQEPTMGFRDDLVPLHFVAIRSWEQGNRQGQNTRRAFDTDDNANEICVDILLLKPTGEEQSYSRTGRGRLIMKSWPDHVWHAEINIL
ncbi:hypothetical protein IFM61392_07097 [Aspergillus lentulus]|nr:hypothetical protein IFM62136_06105 [Aspergillus lentulus]GFG11827.1 hypothetical protein IFM61392_07097 [Aspergillus lentulus]